MRCHNVFILVSLIISMLVLAVFVISSPGNVPPIPDARVGFSPNETTQKYVFVTPNETVYFDASKSFDPDGKVVEYYWQIGTGEIKEGKRVEHKYSEFGRYTVVLTVIDNSGALSLVDSKVDVIVTSALNVKIKKPIDNEGFIQEQNENIEFLAEVSGGVPCYEAPNYKFTWISDIHGSLSKDKGFSIPSKEIKLGRHKITLEVEDCVGNKAFDHLNISITTPLKAKIIKACDKHIINHGRIVFDSSALRFLSFPEYGINSCNNSQYALNIAKWLEGHGNKILIYTSSDFFDKLQEIKNLLESANYEVEIFDNTNPINYDLLSNFNQVWFIFGENFFISEGEFSDVDKYHKKGGNLFLSAVRAEHEANEFYKFFGTQLDNISTYPDSNNCISPNFTLNYLFKNVDKISSSGNDLLMVPLLSEIEPAASINGKAYIALLDYKPITSTEDIYECNCLVDLIGKVSGGSPPYKIKWISLEDGVFDEGVIERDGEYNLKTTPPMVPPLTDGIHSIKFEVIDSSGYRASDIKYEVRVKWCCALNTTCKTYWPDHEGPLINVGNEFAYSCDIYEVCHPDLWQIFREAIECCKSKCKTNCHDKCKLAYDYGLEIGKTYDGLKRCAGLYLVYGFGPEARFMTDYFWPEVCCSNIPFCLTECCPDDIGKCRCMYHTYTKNVYALPCQNYTSFSPRGWKEDTAMNRNSCKLSDLSAHMSVLGDQGIITNAQGINTGTCCDYANALTTALRIIGYKPDEVYSVTGPGHCYNLVKFPKEPRWNIIDAYGNLLENPFVRGGLPGSYYNYCGFYNNTCRNDVGLNECPNREDIYGCYQ
ncbi:MAG: PKD domain-containing protein [Candidatus Altiarchaeota archaeon]